ERDLPRLAGPNQARDHRDRSCRCPNPGGGGRRGDRRPRGRRGRTGDGAGSDPYPTRLPGGQDRGGGAGQAPARGRLLRRRGALGLRRQGAGGTGVHRGRFPGRRVRGLEGGRAGLGNPGPVRPGAAAPLQPPFHVAGGRRGGAAPAPQQQSLADRGGRPRLPGRALPGGGRGRHPRHRRRRRGRREQPPAPGAAYHGPDRHAEDRIRPPDHARDQPGRGRGRPPDSIDQGERARSVPRLRHRRRRDRQFCLPLPDQRRLRPARQALRPRCHLPLRRPGDGLLGGPGAVLPLPVPGAASPGTGAELRRGRGAGCAAGRDRHDPGDRGDQVGARDRRNPGRAPVGLRRPFDGVPRTQLGQGSGLPDLRPGRGDELGRHRVHRRRVRGAGGGAGGGL
ncbi:MAG: Molybdopterin-synthase adenylyltransferase, partial [uncultured Thermomicrobiales bacterium]